MIFLIEQLSQINFKYILNIQYYFICILLLYMGNICSPVCCCPSCCACNEDQQTKTLKVQKISNSPIKSYQKVHYQKKPQDVFEEVTIQDYGQGPHPSIAKYSNMPKLTKQQILVIQRQKPLKLQQDRVGTAYPCFFLLNKRIWYEGEWKKGLPYGKGKAYFQSSGMYYEGYFKQGYAESNDGLAVFPEGSYYRGNVLNSKLIGKGVYFNAFRNVTYRGEWNNDKPQGFGIEQFSNGNLYQGQFKDGYKSGRGKLSWRNGMVYDGDFHLGYMWGNGRLTKGKGIYQGKFQRGVKVGQNISMNTETGIYKGSLSDGKMQGLGQFTWYDKKKYKGYFKNGELHGKGKIQYPNGQTVNGTWSQGMNQGIEKITHI